MVTSGHNFVTVYLVYYTSTFVFIFATNAVDEKMGYQSHSTKRDCSFSF
jgi:hypothetical protein